MYADYASLRVWAQEEHNRKHVSGAARILLGLGTCGLAAGGGEVLAGALQDHGRATVAGATTFGKGSVNVLRPLNDGGGLYVTTARWLTPNGSLIEGVGLSPDIELDLENVDAMQWAIDYLRVE